MELLDGTVGAKLAFIQQGRATRRFHTMRMVDHQRVDAHSYGVAMLVRLLVGDGAPAERLAPLLIAAMDHDLAEWVTGDMPAPTKRRLPDYPEGSFREVYGGVEDKIMANVGMPLTELDARDSRVLKLADAAEGCLHCIEERQMGNFTPHLRTCFYNFWSYCTTDLGLDSPVWRVDNSMPEEPGEKGLRFYISSEWRSANKGER